MRMSMCAAYQIILLTSAATFTFFIRKTDKGVNGFNYIARY